jgi:Fur family transcriptional regulator, peroxide stress response regulator
MRETAARMEKMRSRLKEMGHRITPQRLAILKILAGSEGHPSAEDIYEQVRADFPTTSMATVYKTIAVLKQLGEVLELQFSSDYNRYDGNKPGPHPHLICVKCKRIVDPDLDNLADMTKKLTSETGFRIMSHRLDFYGLCPECQNQKRE